MKVALVQWDIAWEKKQKNFDAVERLIAGAAEREPDLVVLPEMFATGFTMRSEDHVESPAGETHRFLNEMSRKYRIYVIGGLIERGIEKPRNTVIAFNPEGDLLGKYQKIHPFSFQGESKYYEPGDRVAIFEMGGFKTAIFICYDLRFPEVFRHAVYQGASLFVVPANWPASRSHHWQTLLVARAIENQAYVIGANRIGKAHEELAYPGQSMVISPWGKVVAEAPDREGVTFATIDYAEVEKVRKEYPFLSDVRRDLYARLYQMPIRKETWGEDEDEAAPGEKPAPSPDAAASRFSWTSSEDDDG